MDLRICALAEVRKGGSMSKAPDLSAFPIPRKGSARPIIGEEIAAAREGGEEGNQPSEPPEPTDEEPEPAIEEAPPPEPAPVVAPRPTSAPKSGGGASRPGRAAPVPRPPTPPPPTYGQTVATTVKLDESRYLRLMEAGKPGPGR